MSDLESKDGVIQAEMTVSAWGAGIAQLAAVSGLTEKVLVDAALKGAVWCKPAKAHKLRRIRNLQDALSVGDQIYLNFNAAVLAQIPLVPRLVSDEVNYSIWFKPSGMLSQGSKWSDHCTVTETVASIHGKPTFLIHRLDKSASGLIVVAHTKNALKKWTEMFSKREVEKHYQVQVHGKFVDALPATIESPVQGKVAKSIVLESTPNDKHNVSDLLVSIETGRKHQIREHLSSIGFPVVGDRLFDPERSHEKDLALVACKLAFVCPFTGTDKEVSI